MRRLWFFSAVIIAGCLNPDDILPIKGTVDGADRPLQLSRGLNPEGGECTDWKRLKEGTSNADGSFVFDVFRAQAMNLSTFDPFCFLVETTYDNGTHVSSTIEALFGELKLLHFPAWTPALRREGGFVRFEPLAQRDETQVVLHTVEAKRGEQTVWRAVDLGLGGLSFEPMPRALPDDPRIYDEFGGELSVSGRYFPMPMQSMGPIESLPAPEVKATSPELLTLSATQVPPSRGATCEGLPTPCGLTDGQMTGVPLDGAMSLTVNLSPPSMPSLVVLRALVTNSPVVAVWGTQEDGGVLPLGTFALLREGDPLGSVGPDGRFTPSPTFVALPVDAGVPLTSLSVGGETLDSVDEVSVW